jgi:hypothetical protein
MPRRVRIIFSVLFLLLLALLATHIALTWSPAQPLTARVVEQHISPVAGPPNRVVVFELENRSRASIYLATGFLISGLGEKGTSDIADVIQRDIYFPGHQTHDPEKYPILGSFQWASSSTSPHAPASPGTPRPRLIQPGETVRYEVQVSAESLAVARQDDVYVFYTWLSTTRYSFLRFQHRLQVFLGQKFIYPEPFLEFLKPDLTPLQLPETVLPAPGKP